jgi:RNA recognition motif-containing protein
LKRIYVGNLSYQTTEQGLEELFAPYGSVRNASIIRDRQTGQSRGFGFVEMEDDDQASAAIDGLHGQPFDGRTLTVNEAQPRTERRPSESAGSSEYRGHRGDSL